MTNRPPNLPPPGWYQDPEGQPGLRWWDGSTWTQDRAPGPPPQGHGHVADGLTDVGDWIGQSFGIVKERAGHLFTLVVALSVPAGLMTAWAMWRVLPEITITYSDAGVDYQGPSLGAILPEIFILFLSLLMGLALWVAMQRQTIAALLDRPEPWSKSLRDGILGTPRLLANYLLLGLAVFGVLLASSVLSVLNPLLGTFAFLALIVVGLMAMGRLIMFGPTVSCSPAGTRTIKTTLSLSSGFTWPLVGRALLLLLIFFGISIASSVVAAPFGASAGQEFDPSGGVINLGEFVGDNFPQLALTQMISTLVNAIGLAVAAAATSVLYKDRNGPIDPSIGVDSVPSV